MGILRDFFGRSLFFFPVSPIKTVLVKNLVYYILFLFTEGKCKWASFTHLFICQGPSWMHNFNKAGLCPKGIYSWVKKQASKKLGLNVIILIDLNAIRYIYISEMTHVQKLPYSIVYIRWKIWKQPKYPSIRKWLNTLCLSYAIELYTAL